MQPLWEFRNKYPWGNREKIERSMQKKLGICKFSWKFDPNSQEAPKIQQQFDQKRILVVPQVDLFGCGSRTAAITKWVHSENHTCHIPTYGGYCHSSAQQPQLHPQVPCFHFKK